MSKKPMPEKISVQFQHPMSGFDLIPVHAIKEHFQSIGKSVPPNFVFMQYVEIMGESFAIVPTSGLEAAAVEEGTYSIDYIDHRTVRLRKVAI